MRKEVITVWIHPTPQDVVEQHEVRVAQLRREIHQPVSMPSERPVRRWVGRQLVRAGERLAADPSLRPARSH
jgi:hypothetical protein